MTGHMSNRPVCHFISCIKHLQRSLVVSHNDHSRTALAGDIPEEFHDLPTTVAVQCGGGFVSEESRRDDWPMRDRRQLAAAARPIALLCCDRGGV